MQRLEARHRIAVRIVGMQSQPEIGVGEVLGLRHRADVENESVIRLGNLADEPHGGEQGVFRRRYAAQECDTVLNQPREPARSHAAVGLHVL